MSKALLIAGGVLNTIFCLFHVFMRYQIQRATLSSPQIKGLIVALNVAAVLVLLFFAWVSYFHGRELLETGVGRAVLVLVAVFYLARAAEEFILFGSSLVLFAACALVGTVYVALLVISLRQRTAKPEAVTV